MKTKNLVGINLLVEWHRRLMPGNPLCKNRTTCSAARSEVKETSIMSDKFKREPSLVQEWHSYMQFCAFVQCLLHPLHGDLLFPLDHYSGSYCPTLCQINWGNDEFIMHQENDACLGAGIRKNKNKKKNKKRQWGQPIVICGIDSYFMSLGLFVIFHNNYLNTLLSFLSIVFSHFVLDLFN